jgi:hypothetical protein
VPLSINLNNPIKSKILLNNYKYCKDSITKQNNLTLLNKNKENFNLDKNFIE